MVDYSSLLIPQLGTFSWALIPLIIWEGVWTAIAMWKAAKNSHLVWFIVFFVVNLLGIPEIVYIFWFSKKAGSGRSRRSRKR